MWKWILDEIEAWRGYSDADIATLQKKIEKALPGQVVWLSDRELKALPRVQWPDHLGISKWEPGGYKIVTSPHSDRTKGVVVR